MYIGFYVCKNSPRFNVPRLTGRWQTGHIKTTITWRASTQVTTTTLQKNLTAEIKWYIDLNIVRIV